MRVLRSLNNKLLKRRASLSHLQALKSTALTVSTHLHAYVRSQICRVKLTNLSRTIGPAFFSAAIYFSLSRIILVYGTELSFLRPRTITLLFISGDILALALQATGGGIAASAPYGTQDWSGIDIMIAGLSTQVASTAAFVLICLHLMWRVWRQPERVNVETHAFRHRLYFRLFLWGMSHAHDSC